MPVGKCHDAMNEVFFRNETTNLLDADSFRPIKARLLPPESALILPATHSQDDITRFPIWALVSLPFEYNLVTFRATPFDFQSKVCGVVQDLGTGAVGAYSLDDFPSSPAVVTRYLGLSEHAREYLLLYEPDSSTIACCTGVDIMVRGSAASSTVIT